MLVMSRLAENGAMMERIKSGVPGFDALVQGGIPQNDLVLLSGTCGTGKTVFGLQFMCFAPPAEKGIYISFEEDIEKIKETARSFKWDVDDRVKSGKLRFVKYDPFKLEDIFEIVENNIREMNASRIVIDSVSSIGLYVKDAPELRRMIMMISAMLRNNECTSMLISETLPNSKSLSRFGVEEFITDGVIRLERYLVSGSYRSGVSILKMRSTDHSKNIHPYKISEKGFEVFDKDTLVINR